MGVWNRQQNEVKKCRKTIQEAPIFHALVGIYLDLVECWVRLKEKKGNFEITLRWRIGSEGEE